ncbi:BnaAnng12930D [Brassica napus]|uniref:BnaAnng12930D protein n=1 Tax=Brassica napus TaxID=3708 RepID=A0A078IVI2_BRANA|nr:BnaAnng12930D [Brassica napus]
MIINPYRQTPCGRSLRLVCEDLQEYVELLRRDIKGRLHDDQAP